LLLINLGPSIKEQKSYLLEKIEKMKRSLDQAKLKASELKKESDTKFLRKLKSVNQNSHNCLVEFKFLLARDTIAKFRRTDITKLRKKLSNQNLEFLEEKMKEFNNLEVNGKTLMTKLIKLNQLKDELKVEECFCHSFVLDSKYIEINYILGCFYLDNENYYDAQNFFIKVIELVKNGNQASNIFGSLFQKPESNKKFIYKKIKLLIKQNGNMEQVEES